MKSSSGISRPFPYRLGPVGGPGDWGPIEQPSQRRSTTGQPRLDRANRRPDTHRHCLDWQVGQVVQSQRLPLLEWQPTQRTQEFHS